MNETNLMKTLPFYLIILVFACFACSDEEGTILQGAEVTVRNTIQLAADTLDGGTSGSEMSIEMFQGLEEGALGDTAVIGSGIEFSNFIGLYNIDFGDKRITFTSTATDTMNPPFPGYFRIIEEGTFDRYYFTFDMPLGGNFAVSSNDNVNAVFRSSTTLLVEIGEGFDTTKSGFVITVE